MVEERQYHRFLPVLRPHDLAGIAQRRSPVKAICGVNSYMSAVRRGHSRSQTTVVRTNSSHRVVVQGDQCGAQVGHGREGTK